MKAAAEKLAIERIGESFDCKTNESETYQLCKSTFNQVSHKDPLVFFVYDLSDQRIVYEAKIVKGSVEWASDSRIKVREMPGLLKEDESLEDYTYLYDVIKKTRIDHN